MEQEGIYQGAIEKIDSAVHKFLDSLATTKLNTADILRLLELRKELVLDATREVIVKWVESDRVPAVTRI
jgi:hypothetical protein